MKTQCKDLKNKLDKFNQKYELKKMEYEKEKENLKNV